MNCNYKVKITDIQTKYKFKVFYTGYDDSEIKEKIDVMYQAWPKVSGEGETPTLDNTANATMTIDLKGNTSQEGTPTPDAPQDIHVVSGDNTIIVSNSDNIQSQSYPINLGNIELCKIGDYQDSIVKDNGKWYLNKQIGKVILNGSESWGKSSAYSTSTYFAGFTTIVNSLIKQNSYNVICDNFTLGSYISVRDNECISNNELSLNIQILASRLSENTADALKVWLSTHNIIVYYILKIPTNTEITDTTLISQLNTLAGAESYSGQTNISQTNDDKPFILTAKALKDLSNL